MGLDLLSASLSSPSGCACRETRSRAARFDDQLWLALLFPRSACSFSKVLDDLDFQVTRVREFFARLHVVVDPTIYHSIVKIYL